MTWEDFGVGKMTSKSSPMGEDMAQLFYKDFVVPSSKSLFESILKTLFISTTLL